MIPMINTYDTIRTSLHFNKFVVGELLFVEYKCPIEQEAAGVWTPIVDSPAVIVTLRPRECLRTLALATAKAVHFQWPCCRSSSRSLTMSG